MTAGFKPKHQRLVLLVIALVALIGAALLADVQTEARLRRKALEA